MSAEQERCTLSRAERLRGTVAISALMSKGRWGSCGGLKFCYLHRDSGQDSNRIVVSVPKRFFKRAVKRNLLKRRLRDCYRRNKHILKPVNGSVDMLLAWNSPEILSVESLEPLVQNILHQIAGKEDS